MSTVFWTRSLIKKAMGSLPIAFLIRIYLAFTETAGIALAAAFFIDYCSLATIRAEIADLHHRLDRVRGGGCSREHWGNIVVAVPITIAAGLVLGGMARPLSLLGLLYLGK